MIMTFNMRVGIVTLKVWRIDMGKYVEGFQVTGMVNMKIIITFCRVFLQVRYSKITCCIVLSQLRKVGIFYCEIRCSRVKSNT